MDDLNKFEKTELGREILGEWYKEKGVSLEDLERKKTEAVEEKAKPEFVFPTPSQDPVSDIKKEEEEKKLIVKRKIKHLLAIAEKKGLEYSIKEARKQNDSFLLDIYHDVLAKDGSYKKILKK